MSSLINSAMSGLSAAQAALNTASNNIASYNVAGYTRQTTVLTSSNSTLTGSGYVGNGVTVTGVQREYDAFITNQLRAAQNQNSGLTTRYEQMSKIDDVLSDTTNSLSSSLQSFFSSMQTLVSNASDPSSRQALLGDAPDAAAVHAYSLQHRVDASTPPVFLLHAQDDDVVPVGNALAMHAAALRAGVPASLHVFPHGGHGFGTRGATGALARWPQLALDWIQEQTLTP